jgi:hypothetical protein
MAKSMRFRIRKSRSITGVKTNKSIKAKSMSNKIQGKFGIWGKFGSVYSPKKKHYLRLGSSDSFNVIRDELERDEEWYKRVQFMAKRGGLFGDKLKTLL